MTKIQSLLSVSFKVHIVHLRSMYGHFVFLQVMPVLESLPAEAAGELRFDAALLPLVKIQRHLPFVLPAAVLALEISARQMIEV